MCGTCPIFAKWTPDLLIVDAEKTGKVKVMADTRVTRINYNKRDAAVESVTAATIIDGKSQYKDYHARLFVLAAHAIESTRLLLLSGATAESHGTGLKSGSVGKYFATHLSVTMAAELKEKTYLERVGFATAQSHYFYESSRREGGNAFVLYLRNRGITTPFEIVTQQLKEKTIWGDELRKQVQNRFGFTAAIQALVEQLPYGENRISLDKSVADDLGLAVPKVSYVSKQERESRAIAKASATIQRLFLTLGAKNIRSRVTSVATHHMGTCRMGHDPQSSVVDRDLKVHGIENLHIVGSSVFPTFGAIGPTLTIAALALRLADRIGDELKAT
jgi:choline dehydrogenase-like flavoprotein